MLSTPAPFPHVGSFALFIDTNLPATHQRAELVRIIRRGFTGRPSSGAKLDAEIAIAFPNRVGASGNMVVAETDLIDATPLDKAEERELTDLLRDLRGRVSPREGAAVGGDGRHTKTKPLSQSLKAKADRADALRKRQIYSVILESELAVMRAREAGETRRNRGSIGRPLPREEAA